MKFKPGDRVICIDDSHSGVPPVIKRGMIYTIATYYGIIPCNEVNIDVYTLLGMERFNLFYETRFRKAEVELHPNTSIV
jgi:hypothetical protein